MTKMLFISCLGNCFVTAVEMDDNNNNTNNDNNTNNNIIWQMIICHAGVLYYIKVKSFDMKTF